MRTVLFLAVGFLLLAAVLLLARLFSADYLSAKYAGDGRVHSLLVAGLRVQFMGRCF
jgi:hypothetical protein